MAAINLGRRVRPGRAEACGQRPPPTVFSSRPRSSRRRPPTDPFEGIEKYLGSGMIRGNRAGSTRRKLGAGLRRSRVRRHPAGSPIASREVTGESARSAPERIVAGWAEQKVDFREIMLFPAQQNGRRPRRARWRIYQDLRRLMPFGSSRRNPYRLASRQQSAASASRTA